MDTKNKQKRTIITRNSIIEAGINLFSENGYYQTNSKDIAQCAGVSIGSFYTYFTDKKHLITEIIKKYTEDLDDVTINCTEDQCQYDNTEITKYFLNRVLFVAKKYPLAFHREMDSVIYREDDLREFWKMYNQNKINGFAKILENLGAKLRITDYKMSAKIVLGVTNQMIYEYLYTEDEIERKIIINEYIEVLSKYLYI